MNNKKNNDHLYGAAILKYSFILSEQTYQPGFRVVYFGTLKEFGLTDEQVDAYIEKHKKKLTKDIKERNSK